MAAKINLIFFTIIASMGLANTVKSQGGAIEPETKVQISVYDLVGKFIAKKKNEKLDEEYIKKVVLAVATHQHELLSCLDGLNEKDIKVRLKIFSGGSATAQILHLDSRDCEAEVFQKIVYPPHRFSKELVLELNVQLARTTL